MDNIVLFFGSVVIVAALFIIIVWWGNQPVTNKGMKRSDMGPLMERFIRDYEVGAIMTVSHEKSEKFLQFMTIDGEKSEGSVKFGFPRVPGSEPHYEEFKDTLAQEYSVTQYGGNSDVSGFFEVKGWKKSKAMERLLIMSLDYWAMADGEFSLRVRGTMRRDAIKNARDKRANN